MKRQSKWMVWAFGLLFVTSQNLEAGIFGHRNRCCPPPPACCTQPRSAPASASLQAQINQLQDVVEGQQLQIGNLQGQVNALRGAP